MIRRDLLDLLPNAPEEFIAWNTTGDLEAECLRMEAEIRRRGGLGLTVLGLGANGHLGTNEPGSTIDSRCSVVELELGTAAGAARYGATQPPRFGLTMGIGTILESEEIWLLVTGAHKAEVLARAMRDPVSGQFPATFLRTHTNALIIADKSATSAL